MSAACPMFGFVVRLQIAEAATTDALELERDLRRTLDEHGLIIAAGSVAGARLSITREATQAIDLDRRILLDWAARWRHAAHITVSELTDLRP